MWENQWSSREKKLVGVAGALLLLLIGFLVMNGWDGEERKKEGWQSYEAQPAKERSEKTTTNTKRTKQATELVIDVKGAVKKPGVYRLDPGARVQDAVELAGGPKSVADMVRVNLAQPLTDGMALIIPRKGEEIPTTSGIGAGTSARSGEGGESGAEAKESPIDLNTATVQDLDSLNGIGPSKAEAIIRYREENGPFTSVDQLTEVSGIGEKTLEQFKDQVRVQ
ncbi:competence protein ComEA [Marininema mesophilum]|uniref:Competence protein ComEA n=1 Tax=Marininema mesophilum TaxID=1048340 RepID=A0A1H2Y200_9BACL|nr:helix-hairpin-helix domain-containing protein [Marininema mesophilum]SDW99081.1 competence protein ComEA [Marininema mesophilum]